MSVDQYGLCVVCGHRDEHCEECHRGHDYVRDFPQWVVGPNSRNRIVPSRLRRSYKERRTVS